MIQKLAALKSSDAAAFKNVAGRVAEHFLQRAALVQGSEGEELQRLGVQFADAAESGDLSAFQALASAPATPPATPSPPAVDALASALSLVDSITGTSSASGAESFAKLSALKQSSPSEFKQVMNGVSAGLSQLAHYAQGADKDNLSALAIEFASAAETGDISAFEPAGGAPAPTPSAPPAAPPFDALGAAFGLLDSLSGSESASSAESFAKLSALKQSSPSDFKQLMNRVSAGLSQLAHYAQGAEKDSLAQLAVDFASAAETGDISAFGSLAAPPTPPAPPPPPPVDGLSAAFELVDSISGTSGASRAESFAKLSALKQSSPGEFKALMNQVSDGLSRLAHYAEGADKETLSEFAVRFASAGENGDISAFAPASEPVVSSPPPPPPPPFDSLGAAFELVDSITGSASASSSASLEKLADLKQSSPAQFKQVMNRVAEGLAQRAHYAEGADRESLAQMSSRFASAAESGDLSSFAPASTPAEPVPEPEPEVCEEPPAPVCANWRSGQALSAYRNCAAEPVSAVDRTYASALALVNSLTTSQAA